MEVATHALPMTIDGLATGMRDPGYQSGLSAIRVSVCANAGAATAPPAHPPLTVLVPYPKSRSSLMVLHRLVEST